MNNISLKNSEPSPMHLLMLKINELQIELMVQAAELAKTKERLDHLEETVSHE